MRKYIALIAGILSVSVIAFINYQVISSWFGKNGPANLGSIEVSYVSMARFLRDFGIPLAGNSSWAPFWYLGFPFHLFYTPLLPLLELMLHMLLGLPLWESYRLVTGVSYILAPISVFFLGWVLSKRFIGGLISGVFYSVGPTLFYFLVNGVYNDQFSPAGAGFWDPRRFTILVRWGEGPHTLSLVFLPLVGVFFIKFIENRKIRDLLLTCLFLGLAALSNAIGLFTSLILMGIVAFVKVAQKAEFRSKILTKTILVLALFLGLFSFWFNLSFISTFFAEGSSSANLLVSLFPWGWLGIILAVGFVYWLIGKYIYDFGIAVSLLFFLVLFAVVAIYYAYKVDLLPQALRYMTEADLALSLLLGVLFTSAIVYLGSKHIVLEIIGSVFGLFLAGGLIIYIQAFIPVSTKTAGGSVDLEKTAEKRVSKWIETNVDQKSGERVFVPGNYAFYLNWFTNVWQPRGGLFQAATHPWVDHLYYQLANGKDAELAEAWLKIINAKYIIVTTAGSGELYKEIKYPERFESYKQVYQENGDIFYQVPLVKPSIAKVVNISEMSGLKAPRKADQKEPLLSYTRWIENSSTNTASLQVINNDNYKIRGKMGQGEALVVQMTADSGWRASNTLSGAIIKTGKDPMGFLVLYPNPAAADGSFEINLHHKPTWIQWLGYGTTLLTIAFIIWFAVSAKGKKWLESLQ